MGRRFCSKQSSAIILVLMVAISGLSLLSAHAYAQAQAVTPVDWFFGWLFSLFTGRAITGYSTLDTCTALSSPYLLSNDELYECSCPAGEQCAARIDTSSFSTQPEMKVWLSLPSYCDIYYDGPVTMDIGYDDSDIGLMGKGSGGCSQDVAYRRDVGYKRMWATISGQDSVNIKFYVAETGYDCDDGTEEKCHEDDLYELDYCGDPIELIEDCGPDGCAWLPYPESRYGCVPESCTDDCQPGETTCVDDSHWRGCGEAYDGDNCYDWMGIDECSSTQTCIDGECVGPDHVCGDGVCDTSENCEADNCCSGYDTDLQSSDIHCGSCWNMCDADYSCISGECVQDPPTCTDECNEGESECVATNRRWYCKLESDRCYDKEYEYCNIGQECTGGECVEAGLLPDGEACTYGYKCNSGNCRNSICCASGKTCCSADDDCTPTTDYECDASLHYCVERPTLKPNGESCTSNSECQSGNCNHVCCTSGKTCCTSNTHCSSLTNYECAATSHYCVESSQPAEELCAPGCLEGWPGDDVCDDECNVAACNYDEGDCDDELLMNGQDCSSNSGCLSGNCRFKCCESGRTCCRWNTDCTIEEVCGEDSYCYQPAGQCSPGCRDEWLGDGGCDTLCNNIECEWDNGDCPTGTGCNSDDFCDSSLGESCDICDDCACTIYECCAPYSSNAGKEGCVAHAVRVEWDTLCCDGGVYEALGRDCDDILLEQKKVDGSSCTANEECQSGNCDRSICCEYGRTCCRLNSNCGLYEYCGDSYYCIDKGYEGNACDAHVACRSGLCDFSTSACKEEEAKKGIGERCEWSSDCDEGLSCKKARVKDDYYCCPSGNDYCCSSDWDCTDDTNTRDYYCYRGTDPDESKRFSCQAYETPTPPSTPPTPPPAEEIEPEQLPSEPELNMIGESCGSSYDCYSDYCFNGLCCTSGKCCTVDDDCGASEFCNPVFGKCMVMEVEAEEEAVENRISRRADLAEVTRMGNVATDFYVRTTSKESTAVIDQYATAYLVVYNNENADLYIKARIKEPDNVYTYSQDISKFEPDEEDGDPRSLIERGGRWLENWVWKVLGGLFYSDDEGFILIPSGKLLTVSYVFSPEEAGTLELEAEVKFYSTSILGLFYLEEENNLYALKSGSDRPALREMSFTETIEVREPNCGALGLVCY